jgi:hypothetical protein
MPFYSENYTKLINTKYTDIDSNVHFLLFVLLHATVKGKKHAYTLIVAC